MSFSVAQQTKFLKRACEDHLDLDKELDLLGLTYDELAYRNNSFESDLFSKQSFSSNLVKIENLQQKKHGIPTVSFFSGCGGLDLGFECAGYENLVAVENNKVFCQTLEVNNVVGTIVGPPNHSGDVKEREEIVELLGAMIGRSESGFPGVFHGGPPCQSFSIAANQRFSKKGENFKRNGFSNEDYGTLLFDYVYYIKLFKPSAFIIENVAGLLTVDDGEQLSTALSLLHDAGYKITQPTVLNAADFQVPQTRHRVFIVGHNKNNKSYTFPQPFPQKICCGEIFKKSMLGISNHETRKHKAESVIRYMELVFGEREKLGRVDRLDPRLPSKTIIAGGSKGGGRSHLHPFIPRTLSVRECARIQTFPDTYIFNGTTARQFTQVGNAVPPIMASHLAKNIFQSIFK